MERSAFKPAGRVTIHVKPQPEVQQRLISIVDELQGVIQEIRTAIFDRWPDDYVQALLQKIPMGRFGWPEELASMVAWIASPEASFSTGAVFDLSGGRTDY